MSEPQGDIAVIGLAVMGQNLILNMNDNGYTVVAFNRTVSKVDDFLNNEAKGTNVIGAHSIEDMVSKLKLHAMRENVFWKNWVTGEITTRVHLLELLHHERSPKVLFAARPMRRW